MTRRHVVWGGLLFSISLAGVAAARGTRLCHVSSSGAPPQTIEVTQAADVQLHLAHGDVIGNCTDPGVCSAVCDARQMIGDAGSRPRRMRPMTS
jgi:hypothetical protein